MTEYKHILARPSTKEKFDELKESGEFPSQDEFLSHLLEKEKDRQIDSGEGWRSGG